MTAEDRFSLRAVAFQVYAPSLLYAVGLGAVLPVIALSARNLGATVALAALVITLVGVGSLVTNIPSALLTSRFGEKRAIIAAAVWAAAGMLLALGAATLVQFTAGIFMIGMSGAVFNLARQSYLAEAVPVQYRARAMSTLGGVIRIGTFIGPFLGAGVMYFAGLSGAYWTGLAAMLLAAVVSLRIRDLDGHRPPAAGAGAQRDGASGTPGGAAAAPTMRAIARSHAGIFLSVGLGVILISAVRTTRQAVIPLWAEQLGLDAATTSVIYGLSGALDMLVFYPAGKVMDRKGRAWVAVPCMVIMGVALGLLPMTGGVGTLLAVALLIGFGNGIGSGIVMTLGADYAPNPGRPQFLGIWRFLSDVGVMGGPGIMALVTAVASLAFGIWVVAALSFAAAGIFWYWLPRTRALPA